MPPTLGTTEAGGVSGGRLPPPPSDGGEPVAGRGAESPSETRTGRASPSAAGTRVATRLTSRLGTYVDEFTWLVARRRPQD